MASSPVLNARDRAPLSLPLALAASSSARLTPIHAPRPGAMARMSGSATTDQKSGIVADVTRSLGERLGKNPAAVQIVIEEVSTENYGAGGILIADRDAPLAKGDAHADSSQCDRSRARAYLYSFARARPARKNDPSGAGAGWPSAARHPRQGARARREDRGESRGTRRGQCQG